MRRDPAGPGSRGGNRRLDTVEDVRDYVADFPGVFGGIRVDGDLVIASFTADLDVHLGGLRAAVEHPDLVSVEPARHPAAKLESDIREIRRRLSDDPRRLLDGTSPGHLRLRAPFAELAAELHREYGDSLEITVGHKPFPPEVIGDCRPVPLPIATVTVPGLELTVVVDQAHVVPGEDAEGRVVFANCGPLRIEGLTGVLAGGVRNDREGFLAGAFSGMLTMQGLGIQLGPGESMELPLIIGTASVLPDPSYVVPPGRYEVVAAVPFSQPETWSAVPPQLVARGSWLTVEAE